MKPLTIYWRPRVPNPSKVLIILEELGLPYQSSYVPLEDLKKIPFETVNPNGRVPAIHDPNTDITLFESNAIIFYLVSTYDRTESISFTSLPEMYHLQQWSYFQASGQGPYFGQAAWFHLFHPEPVQSACDRYDNELKRVVGVLDRHLANRSWLVGEKCTYADLTFVTWNSQIAFIERDAKDSWDAAKYPNFKRWQEAMLAKDSVKHVMSVMLETEVKSEGRV